MTSVKCSVKDTAEASKTFLHECFASQVADECLLMRLAAAWSIGVARCYSDLEPSDVFAALSPGDWGGLAIIESTFAKLSREHLIPPDEHEWGVAMFLKYALSTWEDILDEDEPRLYFVAQSFDGILMSWLADTEWDDGISFA